MENKIIIPVLAAFILISGFIIYELTQNNLEEIVFDQLTYNYTSSIWIPPISDKGGSLGGYYKINGVGRDFTFMIKLPGAEKAESPLDYTSDGLKGTGRLKSIEVTPNTILALINGDLRKAMFETRYSGNFNMSCAVWTGKGTFSSENGAIPGTFKIDGPMTDWEGTFKIKNDDRIVLTMDFIYYPNGEKNKAKRNKDIIYM